MMVVGCLNVFECEATIGKTLRSIQNFVDRIIVVDGAYEGFSDHARSRDGTMVKVRGFPKPKILIGNDKHWHSQIKKRNQYLAPVFVDNGEWLFIIDGDEHIQSGVDETLAFLEESKDRFHKVSLLTPDGAKYGEHVRLIRYDETMKYEGNHCCITYMDGIKKAHIRGTTPCTLAPLQVIHDQSKRTPEYQANMQRYVQTRNEAGVPK